MKRSVCLILGVMILILASALPSYAGGHFYFRGSVWIGPGWWGPPYPYYYPYYNEPPVIIERQSPVYVQPNRQKEEQDYWYYCTKPEGYYPYIKRCPGGWLKVVPSSPSDNEPSNDSVSSQPEQMEKDKTPPAPGEKRY